MMRVSDLQAFFDHGWNRHDLDVLMTFMADDCVFESTAGAEVCGTRHAGRERVRQAFAKVFQVFPDAHFGRARHFVTGDRGASEWIFTGTTADGKKVEVNALRPLHVQRRQDRGQELLLQEPDFLNRTPAGA